MKNQNAAGASPPFSVSQNYLTGRATIKRLLQKTSITKKDHVIEIGAGKGHITRELAKISRVVEAYEIDGRLCQYLQDTLGGKDNVILKHQDFLKAELPSEEPYKVFSNIPFSVTSKIMHKLTGACYPPQEAWLVMEKGAAKRFAGSPHETLASLSMKPYFDTEIIYYFRREDFHPMPSVDTVLFHMVQKSSFDISISQKEAFTKFIRDSLQQGIQHRLTKKQISTALKQAGLPSIETSGEILYIQWLCLFQCYRRFGGK